jgi:hypothetical protein
MKNIYKRHRFPPSIIRHAVWLYYRFNLSLRDVEDLLAERNVSVSYEAIRLWINKFGPEFTKRLRRRHSGFGDTYFLDEVFVKIGGKQTTFGVPLIKMAKSSMCIYKRAETPKQPNVSSNVFLKQQVVNQGRSSQTNCAAMASRTDH